MTKALVTGATRAPGRAIATMLANKGWNVHALGRDRITLDEMRGEHGIVPLAMDLTDRAGPYTGANATFGEQVYNGVSAYVNEVNAAGGIPPPASPSFAAAGEGCEGLSAGYHNGARHVLGG